MSHVSNFTQAGDKIVLDLINEDNSSSLALSVVSVAQSATVPTTKNSMAVVTALPGSGYSGSVEVEYNRLDIQDFVDLYYPEGLILPQGDAEALSDFLDEINAALAINLILDVDVAEQQLAPWPGIPNDTQVVTADILAGSLVYIGTLSFTVDDNEIPLSSVITTTVLDGLNLPVVGGE